MCYVTIINYTFLIFKIKYYFISKKTEKYIIFNHIIDHYIYYISMKLNFYF